MDVSNEAITRFRDGNNAIALGVFALLLAVTFAGDVARLISHGADTLHVILVGGPLFLAVSFAWRAYKLFKAHRNNG